MKQNQKSKKIKWHYELSRVNNFGQGYLISKITGKILMKKLIPAFQRKEPKTLDNIS
jgi:hypothetical protein